MECQQGLVHVAHVEPATEIPIPGGPSHGTLKLTASLPLQKWGVGRRSFPFGFRPIFRGELLVLGRVYKNVLFPSSLAAWKMMFFSFQFLRLAFLEDDPAFLCLPGLSNWRTKNKTLLAYTKSKAKPWKR